MTNGEAHQHQQWEWGMCRCTHSQKNLTFLFSKKNNNIILLFTSAGPTWMTMAEGPERLRRRAGDDHPSTIFTLLIYFRLHCVVYIGSQLPKHKKRGQFGLLFTVWFPSAYNEHEKSPLWVSFHVYHSSSQIEHENHPWWCVFLCHALLHIPGTFFFHQTPQLTCFGWVLCLMHFTHQTQICRRQGEVERQGEWSANHSFNPKRSQLPCSNLAIA